MSSYKKCKKKIKQSTKLFNLCCFLLLIALVLDLASFCTHFWISDPDSNWNYGLWNVCSDDLKIDQRGNDDSRCQAISQQGVWAPGMPANKSDTLPPTWFQAVQTSEVFGLICTAIATVMLFGLLCCWSNPRLEKVAVFVCAFSGIFVDIGLIIVIWVFDLNFYYFGYSFWIAFAASLVCYITAVLLRVDLAQRIHEDTVVLRGVTTKKGIILHVCGCSSSKNVTISPPESPVCTDIPEPKYSVWFKKPQTTTLAKPTERQRPSSEGYLNSSNLAVPVGVYTRASESHLPSDGFKDVPKIMVTRPPQRSMSCPESGYYVPDNDSSPPAM